MMSACFAPELLFLAAFSAIFYNKKLIIEEACFTCVCHGFQSHISATQRMGGIFIPEPCGDEHCDELKTVVGLRTGLFAVTSDNSLRGMAGTRRLELATSTLSRNLL